MKPESDPNADGPSGPVPADATAEPHPSGSTAPPPEFQAPPPPAPPTGGYASGTNPANGRRLLRRSNDDRVAAGVAGGLGEYFGVDPVLFRVIFAVTSFFGGAGIVAYLIAWILIPDSLDESAPMDRVAAWLRRHRIPFWIAATVAVIIAWASFFSWWAPRPAVALVLALVVLAVVLSRRQRQVAGPPFAAGVTAAQFSVPTAPATTPTGPVTAPDAPGMAAPGGFSPATATAAPLTAPTGSPTPTTPGGVPTGDGPGTTAWLPETRAWIEETRSTSRQRIRRARPVRWAILAALVLTICALALADSITGIPLAAYFWAGGGIVAGGLLVGLALRRTPWTLTLLLVPAIVGLLAYGGSRASLHDGLGRSSARPASVDQLRDDYRLGFGRLQLDLRSIPPLTAARDIDVVVAGGQVSLLLPPTLNATVQARVHAGALEIDGRVLDDDDSTGFNVRQTLSPPTGATGAPLTITVHLSTGLLKVDRR